jgi:hypothetical protein
MELAATYIVAVNLWQELKHSTINRCFAFVVNWAWRFPDAATS